MSKDSAVGFKVGIFVLIALASLTAFIFSVSDTSLFEKGKRIKVVFNFASGVKRSAPVRIAGVEQGIVRNLQLFVDPADGRMKAEVVMWLKAGSRIPVDSVVKVNQLGLMGEKYIEIKPGLAGEYYLDGDTMIGQDPISQDVIAEQVLSAARTVEDAVEGIKRIVGDEKNQHAISGSLVHFNSITEDLSLLLNDIHNGRGTIGQLFYDDQLYQDLSGLLADLKANPWKLLYRTKLRP